MELKPNLQAYTEAQFLTVLQTLWAGTSTEAEHNRLVRHFDEICEHPLGADLLFYSNDYGTWADPEGIIALLKASLAHKGQPGFIQDLSVPTAPQRVGDLATQAGLERQAARIARAASRSTRFPDLLALALALDQAEQQADDALSLLHTGISQLERELDVPRGGLTPAEIMDQQDAERTKLELLAISARKAVWNILGSQIKAETAQRSAQTALTFKTKGKSLEELQAALGFITFEVQQHTSGWPAVEAYQAQLKSRMQAIFERLDERRTRLQAASGQQPWNTASHFSASLKASAQGPQILTPAVGAMNAFASTLGPLQQSVLSAVAHFNRRVLTGQSSKGLLADVLQFSTRLGHDERFVISLPLAELGPLPEMNWLEVAKAHSEIELPLRLGTANREIDGRKMKRVYIASTEQQAMRSGVRVRLAQWDQQRQLYTFATSGAAPASLYWTLPNSTGAPDPAPSGAQYPGVISAPRQPLLEPFNPESLHFDDYVVVFPAGSGIAPLYVMFKDRFDYPGVATGRGEGVGPSIRAGLDSGAGAPVPLSVANELRGRVFEHFDAFKQALWKAVEQESALRQDVASESLRWVHRVAVEAGGGLYDMDNLLIVRAD